MSGLDPKGEPIGSVVYRSASKTHVIRDKLQGYVNSAGENPGSAVISELLQNADDARASLVKLRFFPNTLSQRAYLEVYNDSYFKPKDFANIQQLMAGGKEQEAGKIGAFGTGFISVYHLTDTPHLHSMGNHIIFDPRCDHLPKYNSSIQKETVFRFPWRTEKSAISKDIGGKLWRTAEIEAVKRKLGPVIYRLILFLRKVRTIEVYEGNDDLLFRVIRRHGKTRSIGEAQCTFVTIEYTEGVNKPIDHQWLYYSNSIPEHEGIEDFKIKDRGVSIAFPIHNTDWLDTHVPGTLYNFLPTAIKTGLPFQINGAFFPDNNRRDILLEESTEKARWNRRVIRAIGELFSSVIIDIRDQVASITRFYELLPLALESDQYSYIEIIRQAFIEGAKTHKIVFGSLGWDTPYGLRVGTNRDLVNLAKRYIAVLPTDAPSNLKSLLSSPPFDRPELELRDVLEWLEPDLRSALPLEQASDMINSRQKLRLLYRSAADAFVRSRSNKEARGKLIELLRSQPIFLAEDGQLYEADKIWCADRDARELELAGTVRFVDHKIQQEFGELLIAVLKQYEPRNLVEYLREQMPDAVSLKITDAPALVNHPDRLRAVLRYLGKHIDELAAENLSNIPLVLDETGTLWRAKNEVRWPTHELDQQLLRRLGIPFVNNEFAEDDPIRALYRQANVTKVSYQDAIAHIEQSINSSTPLVEAPSPINSAEKLNSVWEYFHRQHQIGSLGEADKDRLLHLSIVLTTGGNVEAIEVLGNVPLLLFDEDTTEHPAPLDTAGYDVLINPAMLGGNVRFFLRDVLEVQTLSPLVAIEKYLLPRYRDVELSDEDRYLLLDYMRTVWERPDLQESLLPIIKRAFQPATSLILRRDAANVAGYCDDQTVYFVGPKIHRVFPSGFVRPHEQYAESVWHKFLHALGVQEHPLPKDLVTTVRKATAGDPDDARIAVVREVYNLIGSELGPNGLYTQTSDEFRELARMKWLPGILKKTLQWYSPQEVARREHAHLVGEQVPLLYGLEDPKGQLRLLLKMPDRPDAELIALHLLDLSRQEPKQPAPPDLYQELGKSWQRITSATQQRLKTERVVWASDAYHCGQQVLWTNQSPFFGHRRGYWTYGLDLESLAFLANVDAQEAVTDWRDHLAFIEEIAADYALGQPLKPEDITLVLANFNQINPQIRADAFAALDETAVQQILGRRVFLTADGCLSPAIDGDRRLKLAAGLGSEFSEIPAELLGAVRMMHPDLSRSGGVSFLTDILSIDTISPYTVAHDDFVSLYEQEQSDEVRLRLLEFLGRLWSELSLSSRTTLGERLKGYRLIRCQDDYYPAGLVYFDTAELNQVFRDNYRRVHSQYNLPQLDKGVADLAVVEQHPFGRFLRDLGVQLRPVAADLVETIRSVVISGTTPTEDRIQLMRPLYEWLRREIDTVIDEGEREHLLALKTFAWMPAERNSVPGWYEPRFVYSSDDRAFIGTQAPVSKFPVELDRLIALTKFLEMPSEPPADIVARHLLFEPPDQPRPIIRIYGYLGKHWDDISEDLRQALHSGKVVWDEKERWPASKVFFRDADVPYARYFGTRRCYYKAQSDTDVTQFLQFIGVIDEVTYKADPVEYHLELLHEIADDYVLNQRRLSAEDRALLIINFDYLGSLPDDAREEARESLANLRIIPSRAGDLHAPSDIVLVESAQQGLLRLFQSENPPVVDDGTADIEDTQSDSRLSDAANKGVRLTEAAFQFLKDLGVPLLALGDVVTCNLESADEEHDEPAFANYLHQLDSVFRRFDRSLAKSDWQRQRRSISLDVLNCVQVVSCTKMRVQYWLTYPSGRKILAQPSDKDWVLFVVGSENSTQTLYMRRRGDRLPVLALARELERLFFPGSNYLKYLEDVLNLRDATKAAQYLTRYKFRDDRGNDAGVWGEDIRAVDIDEFGDDEDEVAEDTPSGASNNEAANAPSDETPQTESSGNVSEDGNSSGNGEENDQPETDGDEDHQDDAGDDEYVPDDTGGDTESESDGTADDEAGNDPKSGGYSGAGSSGGAGGGSNGGRRNTRRRSSGGRSHSGNNNGDTSSERHDWEPDVEANVVPPDIRAHEPTQRESRASNGGGRSVTPSNGNGTSSDPHEPQPHDRLTKAAKDRIGQWGERYALKCLKQEVVDSNKGAIVHDIVDAAGEIVGFVANIRGKKIAEASWHNAGGTYISDGRDITLKLHGVEYAIEVKATTTSDKEWINLSARQWDEARPMRDKYRICRVYNAGRSDAWVEFTDDPVGRWERNELALNPLRVYL